MNHLEHAKVYLDLPKEMQDDDAVTFARDVESLYRLLDKYKAENSALLTAIVDGLVAWDNAPTGSLSDLVQVMSPHMQALRELVGERVKNLIDAMSATCGVDLRAR